MSPEGKHNNQCNHKEHGTYKIGSCKRKKIKQILGVDLDKKPETQPIDLDKITSPNREQRAHGTNIYYGKASELLKDAVNQEVTEDLVSTFVGPL